MKKILLTAIILLNGVTAFCQSEEKNGTIYIRHPYINIVEKGVSSYLDKDETALRTIYSDTAKYWISGLEKFVPMDDAYKMWWSAFDAYDNIKMTPMGYPDYMHYIKGDAKIVQSWWIWSATSKKDNSEIKVYMVMFDEFNNDGKISRAYIYGDFPKN